MIISVFSILQKPANLKSHVPEEATKRKSLLTPQQQLDFERKGHLCIRKLFTEAETRKLKRLVLSEATDEQTLLAYKHRVSVLCEGFDCSTLQTVEQARKLIKSEGSDELGFLQMFNLHRRSTGLRKFVRHELLCKAAAELLATNRVRLYQDCLFIKEPGFGVTNWHSDLNMVPFDTNSFLTFWIPVHRLSAADSRLHFASASHRDFALPYWQSNKGMESLEKRGYAIDSYPELELGDVTVHHGWTLHWASQQPNSSSSPRLAWTVSYFADGARILDTKYTRRNVRQEDSWSFGAWFKECKEGQLAQHKLLPLVFDDKVNRS